MRNFSGTLRCHFFTFFALGTTSMKNALVIICLSVAVATATAMYAHRSQRAAATRIDGCAAALAGIEKVLPAGARLSFSCPNSNAELYATCRYVLVPMYLSFRPGEHFDTALTLLPAKASDSEIQVVTANRRVLWQSVDTSYRYYLTRNP